MNMTSIKKRIIYLFALTSVFITFPLFAANITATVSKNRVVKNEVFQLKVVVDEKVSSDAIDFSQLEGDFYLGRPNFGSSLNIINGNRMDRSEWNITLAPQRLGVLTIPAFKLENARSTPIKIQVSMDADEPSRDELIELQNSLDKTTLYPNEQLILQTRLVIKTHPRQLQNPQIDPPQSDGLNIDAIGEPKQYQQILDGIQVTIVDQSYKVTSTQPGTFSLAGIGFKGSAVYSDNLTGRTRLVSLNTPAQQFEIKVEAIPEQMNGSWLPASSLTLNQQWLDSQGNVISEPIYNALTGDSITRTIELDIKGLAVEYFPDIAMTYPASVRLYAEKPTFTQIDASTTRMTQKQVLIAQKPASIVLPEFTLDWWNSTKQMPSTASIDGLELQIEQGHDVQPEALPVRSSEPAQPTTITVTDSGIWPYLAALFAALWLATLAMWFKKKPIPIAKPVKQTETLNTTQQLINALQHADTVQANRLFTLWLNENSELECEIKDLIHKEISLMNQSKFSQGGTQWTAEEVIKMIRKYSQHSSNTAMMESTLPPL